MRGAKYAGRPVDPAAGSRTEMGVEALVVAVPEPVGADQPAAGLDVAQEVQLPPRAGGAVGPDSLQNARHGGGRRGCTSKQEAAGKEA